jgi:hypothetical protein
LREAVAEYVPDALSELARLAMRARSEAVRLAAIRELLDRRYGKAPQGITLDANAASGPLTVRWEN